MIALAAPFTPQERAAWSPPERLSGSAWAERYHVLPRRGSAEPGPYRLDRTPYAREILDTLSDLQHTEVILCKPVQIGGTEIAKAAIGGWVDSGDGDSILLTLPSQKAAEAYVQERIQPLLETPRLAHYVTDRSYDVTKGQIDLAHMSIHSAWTGSPQTMATRAIRFAISDETDKAQDLRQEAAALDLVRDRLVTFGHRAKHFILSTPTTSDGPIWTTFQGTADKRYFHCPCPHCGTAQRLVWEQVRWAEHGQELPDDRLLSLADDLLSGRAAAWYECAHCHAEIGEPDRMRMVEAGEWVSVLGPNPVSTRVAYHLSALYSPWVSFARLVAEYLRAFVAQDTRNFRNGFLGLPQEEGPVTKRTGDVFTPRAKLHRPFVVPAWATILTAGADTQAKGQSPYWVYTVRAWGPRYRSRLVACGKAHSPEELVRLTIDATFPVEGSAHDFMSPLIVCVDSGGAAETIDGNTTWTVYQMARRDPGRIVPIKGHAGRTRPDRPIRTSSIMYQPPGVPSPPMPVLLHIVDTEHFKDRLDALIYDESDPPLWEESDCLPEGYVAQMTAEEKTRIKLGKRSELRWVNNTRSRSDYWDASGYCLAAAHMVRADERTRQRAAHAAAPPRTTPPTNPNRPDRRLKTDRPGGWISRRR
ncbi:MAG: phage terminase large subunit family protein [Planctomycetes bacterium]|nr:phage terminase large subunit family protein [Planctomycetota bacterium]